MKIKLTIARSLSRKRLLLTFMRTFIFLLCTTVFSFNIENSLAQEKVTIDHDKILSVDEVFNIIIDQTKYSFIYPANLFKDAPKVEVKQGKISVGKLLQKTLPKNEFNIILGVNDRITIKKKSESQQISVIGKVVDVKGMPILGVTVLIKGTAQGTSTDFDGSFRILIPNPENVLQFSHLGYKTQVVVIRDQYDIKVVLEEEASELEEITVISTGYQTLKKERATGSYVKPDMKILNSRDGAYTDLVSRLEGTVPGLTIITGFDAEVANPIGNGVTKRNSIIRGRNSPLLDFNPLYVVDGVQVPYFDIVNSEDIEDITVLKDAAATAVWGARASNGVIVVNTKRGKKNDKIQVNYKTFFNFQGKPDFDYDPVLSSEQYIQTAKELFAPDINSWGSLATRFVAPHEQILYDQYRGIISEPEANARLDSLASINNIDQIKDLWYRNAYSLGHTMSVSGGSKNYSFYGALAYRSLVNNQPGTKNNTYNLALNQDFQLNDNINIALNTSISNSVSSRKNSLSIGNRALPYLLFKDANGNDINMPYMFGWSEDVRLEYEQLGGINLDYYPLKEIDYKHGKNNNWNINLTGNLDVKIMKGLRFHGTYGYITTPGTSTNYEDYKTLSKRKFILSMAMAPPYVPETTYFFPNTQGTTQAPTGGTYISSNIEQHNWTVRNQLIYSTSLRNEKDFLNIQVGQEANEALTVNKTSVLEGYDEHLQTYALIDYYTAANEYIYPSITGFGAYQTPPFTFDEEKSRFTSFFALADYLLNHKYGINLSWRRDHSNLFGNDKSTQNKPTYSVGGKWILGRENFIQNVEWINEMALRTTFGVSGNSPFAGTATSQDVLTAPFSIPVTGNYLNLSGAANKKLGWEITKTINTGLDFSILKNRITGSLDLYWKKTTDLLGTERPNPFTGFSSGILSNIGNATNKGVELSLRTHNVKTDNFNWITNFVFSHNKNKLDSYSGASSYYSTTNGRISAPYVEGYSLNPLFAYRYGGLDENGNPQIELSDGTKTTDPFGDELTIDDILYMGSTVPKVTGGLTNIFSYKDFSLTANIIYNFGHVMRNDVNTFFTSRLTGGTSFSGNISTSFLNRWKEPGDEGFTDIPRYYADSYDDYINRNTQYYTLANTNVLSASYVKLRDVTLTYSLPQKVTSQLNIQGLSFSAQVSNFLLWTENDEGIDPEFHEYRYGSRTLPPSNHPFNFSMNITF
ncbi:SusC/RagA family TonB-linked outer membrane protein [Flavivirga sp. 57AJ16]|nr:SusC/RagA family TonB-linked outer membrane protein [Flavivirga sp. 57AJ16]